MLKYRSLILCGVTSKQAPMVISATVHGHVCYGQVACSQDLCSTWPSAADGTRRGTVWTDWCVVMSGLFDLVNADFHGQRSTVNGQRRKVHCMTIRIVFDVSEGF